MRPWLDRAITVEVEWVDSCHTNGWISEETFNERFVDTDDLLLKCRTIGELLRETDQALVIAQSVSSEGQVDSVMVIPRRSVTFITKLTR